MLKIMIDLVKTITLYIGSVITAGNLAGKGHRWMNWIANTELHSWNRDTKHKMPKVAFAAQAVKNRRESRVTSRVGQG